MVVNRELLCTFSTRIDEAKTVGLSSLEVKFGQAGIVRTLMTAWSSRAIEVHLAIDQVVVTSRNKRTQGWCNDVLHDWIVATMVPIGEHDRAKIYVVRHIFGSMHDHWTYRTIGVLCRVVSMIPCSTIELCLEPIGEGIAWWDGALSESRNTVHPLTGRLEKAMPVKCRTLAWILNIVVNSDFDSIAPISLYGRLLNISSIPSEIRRAALQPERAS